MAVSWAVSAAAAPSPPRRVAVTAAAAPRCRPPSRAVLLAVGDLAVQLGDQFRQLRRPVGPDCAARAAVAGTLSSPAQPTGSAHEVRIAPLRS